MIWQFDLSLAAQSNKLFSPDFFGTEHDGFGSAPWDEIVVGVAGLVLEPFASHAKAVGHFVKFFKSVGEHVAPLFVSTRAVAFKNCVNVYH